MGLEPGVSGLWSPDQNTLQWVLDIFVQILVLMHDLLKPGYHLKFSP